MSNSSFSDQKPSDAGNEEVMSALFAQLVMQQANMATMLLGKAPDPQTGQSMCDLEGARMFIDQLEMLEVKTKGNLTKDEATLLKQSLMSLRLAFVEAVESPAAQSPPQAEQKTSTRPETVASGPAAAEGSPASHAATSEAETNKKFTKKY